MAALENTHIPAHWHEAMEILFCLNGSVRVHVEHERLTLQRNQLIVFDSKEVHSIHSDSNLYMFLCIHVCLLPGSGTVSYKVPPGSSG